MKSKVWTILLLSALSAPLAAVDMSTGVGSNYKTPPVRGSRSKLDRSELRAAVDESQALLDSLGRETRGLGKAEHDELITSLRKEYHLDNFGGKGRKALEQAELVLELQEAIKKQQALLKTIPPLESEKEESKLLGQQTDLVGAVEDLRETLTEIHKNASEEEARAFDNWIMISEGLLRQRREDREAQAQAPAGNGEAASPTSATDLCPTAEVLSAEDISPTVEALPVTTPVPAKGAKP